MTEPHLRLQEARRRAGFETASDAARAFGWNENTYRSHENGERGLRPGVVAQYARALRSSPSWILLGETPQMEIEAIERDPILVYRNDIVSNTGYDGATLYVDTSMIYTSLPHKFLLLHDDLFPKHEQFDLLIMTAASVDNNTSKNDFLMEDHDGRWFFGDLLSSRGDVFIKTPKNELIPAGGSRKLYLVVGVIKRSFYELTDIPPPATP